MVSPINSTVPSGPPTSATQRTRIRSRSENSIPMENMSMTTPISANTSKWRESVMEGPGVKGLITMPPTT